MRYSIESINGSFNGSNSTTCQSYFNVKTFKLSNDYNNGYYLRKRCRVPSYVAIIPGKIHV